MDILVVNKNYYLLEMLKNAKLCTITIISSTYRSHKISNKLLVKLLVRVQYVPNTFAIMNVVWRNVKFFFLAFAWLFEFWIGIFRVTIMYIIILKYGDIISLNI